MWNEYNTAFFSEVPPILFKVSANRMQSRLLGIAEAPPILCKVSANRMQLSLLGIAEVPPKLCKVSAKHWDIKIFELYFPIHHLLHGVVRSCRLFVLSMQICLVFVP